MPATAQKPQAKGWSDERRARQSAAIKRWSPWTKSTGPRTAAGKARAAQNAAKQAQRPDPDRLMKNALRMQSKYLYEIKALCTLEKNFPRNELLKKRRKILLKQGHNVTAHLVAALTYVELCKNLAKTGSLSLKVNGKSSIGSTLAQQAADGDGIKRAVNDS